VRILIRFLLWTLLLVGITLGAARALAIRWFQLPTNDPIFETSVLPSLRGGDWVLASRITTPHFGDLVVCPEPEHPDRYIIGRIIGQPGDTVEIDNGIPVVGSRRFVKERNCEESTFKYPNPNDDSEEVTQKCDMEATANHLHMMGALSGHKIRPESLSFDVTDGKLFLISDNRLYPYDSRNFGLVDIDSCKETIVARLVSKDGWMDADNRLDYIR